MSNIVPISDIERMATAVAKSGLFGVRTSEQAMALMLIAQAEGLHPAIAARDYHVINGRPALKADAMLARFQTAGGAVKWTKYTDEVVSATISHPQGGSVEIEWTLKMAERAGLTKNPTWRQYPRQMLRARVISEGIRTVFPGVVVGTYTPEEVQDFDPERQVKDITPEVEEVREDWVLPHLQAITAAADMAALKTAFDAAAKAARKAGDSAALERIVAAKDARKHQLTEPEGEVIDVDPETGEVV